MLGFANSVLFLLENMYYSIYFVFNLQSNGIFLDRTTITNQFQVA